jgi:SMC interacting uncharacterized protein involved in chromosome segregation
MTQWEKLKEKDILLTKAARAMHTRVEDLPGTVSKFLRETEEMESKIKSFKEGKQ